MSPEDDDAVSKQRIVNVVLALVVGIAVLLFLHGTSRSSYDLDRPLTLHHDESETVAHTTPEEPPAEGPKSGTLAEKVARSCDDCHGQLVTAAEHGHRRQHPINVEILPDAKLQAILSNGGRLIQQEDGTLNLSCRTCHWPHAEKDDARLIVEADNLCLICHTHVEGTGESHHPLDMELKPKIKAKVEYMGGVLGPDGLLSCLSCHVPHKANQESLIRAKAEDGPACAVCHEGKGEVMKGSHGKVGCPGCHGMHKAPDIRRGARIKNVGPQPCLDCHTNKYPKAPQIDVWASHPLGKTIKEERAGDLPLRKGRIGCTTCHNQHSAERKLLRAQPPDLCLTCHPEKRTVVNTDHDATVIPVGDTAMTCISCHRPHAHDSMSTRMVATKRGDGINPANGRCLYCHDGSTQATVPGPHNHPNKDDRQKAAKSADAKYDGPIFFVDENGYPTKDLSNGEPACSTCHNPHQWSAGSKHGNGAAEGDNKTSFLRDRKKVLQLCTQCHSDKKATANYENFHSKSYREAQEVW